MKVWLWVLIIIVVLILMIFGIRKLLKYYKKYKEKIDKVLQGIKQSLRERWPKIREKIPSLLGLILLFFVIKFVLILGFKPLFLEISNIFVKNLGRSLAANIIFTIIYSFYILFFIYILVWVFHKNFDRYRWVWRTVLLMIFIFITSIFLINSLKGIEDIHLYLNDDDMGRIRVENGNLTCPFPSNAFLVNDIVSCSISPYLKNISATVHFILLNGTQYEEDFSKLSFKAPADLNEIVFMIRGIDDSGNIKHFSTANKYYFLTKQEYEAKRLDFINYILIVLGIIFFSIPSMMNNFKNLSKKEDK